MSLSHCNAKTLLTESGIRRQIWFSSASFFTTSSAGCWSTLLWSPERAIKGSEGSEVQVYSKLFIKAKKKGRLNFWGLNFYFIKRCIFHSIEM